MKALGHSCGSLFQVPNWKQEKQAAICNELHCITYSRKEPGMYGSVKWRLGEEAFSGTDKT